MALEDIVNVTITAQTQTPTRAGFGVPLVFAYHTRWLDRYRSYTGIAGMAADGFVDTDPAYQIAAAIFAQSPAPPRVKIGRRTAAFTQVVRLIPTAPTTGKVYSIKIGTSTVTYTAVGGDTVASVATALATAITALPAVTASGASGTYVAVTTDTAGVLVGYSNPVELGLSDQTAAPSGMTADLDAIRAIDDDWYGIVLDSQSAAEITALAPWTEAQKKILVVQTGDSAAADPASTTDILATLETAGYARTVPAYQKYIATNWLAAGWLAGRLTADPGSDTWAFKTLRGVATSSLTDTEKSAVHAKNGNTYTTVAGVGITEMGTSSAGEFADITRFSDWLIARMKERIFGVIISRPKLAYTDSSVDVLRGEILAQLQAGVSAGGLSPGTPDDPDDPAPSVTAPRVADVPVADRAARYLPDVRFSARFAGAIHRLLIQGTVGV